MYQNSGRCVWGVCSLRLVKGRYYAIFTLFDHSALILWYNKTNVLITNLKVGRQMSKSVKRGKLTDYVPNPHNSNEGSERGQGMIESSFRKYGAGRSMVVDKNGVIIAGNHSQDGAINAGLEDVIEVETDGKQVVVVRRTDLDLDDESDMRAVELGYIDNRSGEVSLNWDTTQILADLGAGADLSSMFTETELANLISRQIVDEVGRGLSGEDDTPPVDPTDALVEKWGVEQGQLWRVGQHRVLCGDCRNVDDVARLMDGKLAQIAFTSPPYALRRADDYGGTHADEYVDWFNLVQSCTNKALTKDGSFFVNIKPHSTDGERVLYVFDLVLTMKRQWGWHFIDEFSWNRATAPGAWKFRFRNGFEPVYHFCKATGSDKFYPKRVGHYSDDVMVSANQTGGAKNMSGTGTHYNISGETAEGIAQPDNVITVAGVEHGISHSAMFPMGLPEHFMQAFTDKGDIAYEPFLGSGTTLMACEKQNRALYGMEILPKYVAVILERAEQHGIEGIETLL